MRFDLSAFPLSGRDVTLRLWAPDDAQWYVESLDDEIFQFTTESPDLTVDAARKNIEAYLNDPNHASLAIIDRTSGKRAGGVNLVPRDTKNVLAEVSYWLAPSARGRGLATEAVELLCKWAFGSLLSLSRIELLMLPQNSSSRSVAERAGFRFDGVVRRDWKGEHDVEMTRYLLERPLDAPG
jgi:RimJ/RimL family protein N-acetyltransferase